MTTYKISVSGLNLHHIIAYIEKEKLHIKNLIRKDQNVLEFYVSKKDFKKLKKCPYLPNYKLEILEEQSFKASIKRFFSHLGLYLGIGVVLFSILLSTNTIQSVEILTDHTCYNGEQCIFKKDFSALKSELANLGIKKGAPISTLPSSIDAQQRLMLKFKQIAGVTIKRKGVKIILSIEEAKLPINDLSNDLIAPESGIITFLDVSSGTPLVKLGDIVIKGQTLIKAQSTPVSAQIKMKVFYHDAEIFNQNQISYKRTGKKAIERTIELFNLKIGEDKPNFSLYESQTSLSYLSYNLFLPIKTKTTTYYELVEDSKFIDFESVKEQVEAELLEQTKKNVPEGAEIITYNFVNYKEGDLVRVDCYIEAILSIKK